MKRNKLDIKYVVLSSNRIIGVSDAELMQNVISITLLLVMSINFKLQTLSHNIYNITFYLLFVCYQFYSFLSSMSLSGYSESMRRQNSHLQQITPQ